VLLDARVGIAKLGWRDAGITDLRLRAEVAHGRVALDEVAFSAAGGRVTGAVSAEAGEPTPHLAAHIEVADTEVRQLLRLAGIGTAAIGGRLTGRARLAATGTTKAEATRTAAGQVVLTMGRGQIAREAMLLASTDIRRLFGSVSGTSPISCLLAVMDVRDGIGVLAPLRIRSGQGTLFGAGTVDLGRETLDLAIKTVSSSTGFFALDVPVRIVGPIDSPTIRPAIGFDARTIADRGLAAARRPPPAACRRTCAAWPPPARVCNSWNKPRRSPDQGARRKLCSVVTCVRTVPYVRASPAFRASCRRAATQLRDPSSGGVRWSSGRLSLFGGRDAVAR